LEVQFLVFMTRLLRQVYNQYLEVK
jgi:hypothetical protein